MLFGNAMNRLHPSGLALAAILVLAVWHFGRIPGDGPLIGPLHSAAHFPLFGLLAAIVFVALRRSGPPACRIAGRTYLCTFLTMLLISGVTEWSQRFTDRNASLWDVAVNMAGTVAALALIALYDPRVSVPVRGRLRRLSLALVPVVLSVLVLLPVAVISAALMKRDADFPCIVCPKNRLDLRLMDVNGATARLEEQRNGDGKALHIRLLSGTFPGVAWETPVPDWSGYDALVLEMTNPDTSPLQLTLRIDDAKHNFRFADRFNHRITLEPAGHHLECIPLAALENAPRDRKMDLGEIARVLLFGTAVSHGRSFYLHNIRLFRGDGELGGQDPCSLAEARRR
jgi:VanZ family protein